MSDELPKGWALDDDGAVCRDQALGVECFPAPHMQRLRIYNHRPPYGHVDIPLAVLRALVPAADVPTPEERAVLKAVEQIPGTWLSMAIDSSQVTRGLAPMAAAELARRAAKEAKGG